MFHEPVGIFGNRFRPILTGFSQSTDLVPSFDNGVNYVATFVDPFPTGVLEPIGNSNGLATNLGQSVSFNNQSQLKIPYNQRWSLTIQHMLQPTRCWRWATLGHGRPGVLARGI